MADKKGDDIENNDELNDQSSSDFNEADDSFGLPDVDYKPLEEEEVQDDNVSQGEDIQDQIINEDSSSEENSEEYAYESETEEETQEPEYVPGSYTRPEEESSNVGKVVGIVVLVVLAALAIWYFGFYGPAQEVEKQRQEQLAKQEQAEREERERKAQAEREAQEAAEREAARLAEEEAANQEPEAGTVQTIESRTGRFYIVIASALDGDLAMDYANKLAADGLSLSIIPPFGTSKFHRVAVDDEDSWAAAENRANELKGEYGEDVWVIKY